MTVAPGWTEESAYEFRRFVAPLSNWGRWGEAEELGTVNLLTAERAAAATALAVGATALRTSPALVRALPVEAVRGMLDLRRLVADGHPRDAEGCRRLVAAAVAHADAIEACGFNRLGREVEKSVSERLAPLLARWAEIAPSEPAPPAMSAEDDEALSALGDFG